MCSGITAYGALKYLNTGDKGEPALIVGLGGVGMMALQFALEMFDEAPIVADLDDNKLQAAMGPVPKPLTIRKPKAICKS